MTKKMLASAFALLLLSLSYCESWQHRPVTAIVLFALSALAAKVGKL